MVRLRGRSVRCNMSLITVLGIDRDEESRRMTLEVISPYATAQVLFESGWKWAVLVRDGVTVGGVCFNCQRLAREWWGEAA